MPQVKIYGTQTFLGQTRAQLSEVIHRCMVAGLGVPAEKRFQRFIALAPEDFIYPGDRSDRYIILEISMFEGRSTEVKKNLIRLLIDQLTQELGLAPMDIEITLFETPTCNWGIRGRCGDELSLPYVVTLS